MIWIVNKCEVCIVPAAYWAVSAPTGCWLWCVALAWLSPVMFTSLQPGTPRHGESRAWLVLLPGHWRTGSRGWHCRVEPSLTGDRAASATERHGAERAVSEAQRSALHTHSSTHTSLYTDPGPRVWWWWWWCNHGECQSCQCPAPVTWAPPPGPASRLVMVIIQWSLASQYADNFYLEMCVSESTRTKWV